MKITKFSPCKKGYYVKRQDLFKKNCLKNLLFMVLKELEPEPEP
jgi:hypothetical protein